MLELAVAIAVAILFFIIAVFAMNKSRKVREKMFEEFESNEDGQLDVYMSEGNLAVVPFPTPQELGITQGSSLERVYNFLTLHHYLKPRDYKFLKIQRSAGYIYRLRKMGFTIATEKTKEGKFIGYKLICYKLK